MTPPSPPGPCELQALPCGIMSPRTFLVGGIIASSPRAHALHGLSDDGGVIFRPTILSNRYALANDHSGRLVMHRPGLRSMTGRPPSAYGLERECKYVRTRRNRHILFSIEPVRHRRCFPDLVGLEVPEEFPVRTIYRRKGAAISPKNTRR